MGTLRDIEEYWDLSDVLDAVDYLDFTEDLQQFEEEKAAAKAGK